MTQIHSHHYRSHRYVQTLSPTRASKAGSPDAVHASIPTREQPMSRPAAGNPLMPPRAPGKASERVVQRRPKHVGPSLWNAISRAATGWTVCAAALGNLRAAHGHPFGAAASRPTASLFPNVYVGHADAYTLSLLPNH